jgi:hypothetical protein
MPWSAEQLSSFQWRPCAVELFSTERSRLVAYWWPTVIFFLIFSMLHNHRSWCNFIEQLTTRPIFLQHGQDVDKDNGIARANEVAAGLCKYEDNSSCLHAPNYVVAMVTKCFSSRESCLILFCLLAAYWKEFAVWLFGSACLQNVRRRRSNGLPELSMISSKFP